jgi:hypothetical protein
MPEVVPDSSLRCVTASVLVCTAVLVSVPAPNITASALTAQGPLVTVANVDPVALGRNRTGSRLQIGQISVSFQPVNIGTAAAKVLASYGMNCIDKAPAGAKAAAISAVNYGLQEFFHYARAGEYATQRSTKDYSSKIVAEYNVAAHGEDLPYIDVDDGDDNCMMVTNVSFEAKFENVVRKWELRSAGGHQSRSTSADFGTTSIEEWLIEDSGTNGGMNGVTTPAACILPAFYSIIGIPGAKMRNAIRVFPAPTDSYPWSNIGELNIYWYVHVTYIPFPEQVTQADIDNKKPFPLATKAVDLYLMPMILNAGLNSSYFDHQGNAPAAANIKEQYARAVQFMSAAGEVSNDKAK